ncbi:MAG: extracellular solute-binding protein [Chloroflexota bacterium]|nr:extracellular solute-binding protein [Chloroflexia bacterium]MDQ3227949.1 extracellular solute-binding protein [Chloroflexota bacterium]
MSEARDRSETFRVAIRRFGPFESAIQKQWVDFQRETGCPLHLEWESLDLNPLVDSLFTQGGLEDGTWDIAFVVTDWLADAVHEGLLRDLAPAMRADPVPDYPAGWVPVLTGMQQFGDAVYGLPYHDGPECLVYRTDLFADAAEQQAFVARFGYPLDVPRTWEHFEDIARFFTRPADGLYGTVFAAFPDGHNTVYDFCLQLWSRGGELTDATGRPTLATPRAIAALDFYRRMVNDRSVTPPGLEAVDSVKSGELFASGAVAMMVNWFGFAAVCEQPGCPVKGKTAVTTLPSAEGMPPASFIVYWLLAVAAGSPHPDQAYAFARHCCTPAMDKLATLAGAIGCRLSTWSDSEVNALIPFYSELARLHEGTRTLPRSRALPAFIHIIDEAVQAAIAGPEPTATILTRAQERAVVLQL